MQTENVNGVGWYYKDHDGAMIEIIHGNLTEKTFYTSDAFGKAWRITSEISGNSTTIRLSNWTDYSKVEHLHLKTVLWGSWETPISEREKGYQLTAIVNGIDLHVTSFYLNEMIDDEILEVAGEFAKFIGVELKVS